ncbi:MAG TPA: S8 family peptidase [Actinomycetota bacterium]|nr:S8 family peptidase [Actinomycetota bacterium]
MTGSVIGRARAALALIAVTAATLAPASGRELGGVEVLVLHRDGAVAAGDAVRDAGGTVGLALPVASSVSALVPVRAVRSLEAQPGVVSVTPNDPIQMTQTSSDSTSTVRTVYAREVGADRMRSSGVDGTGVRVALIDTGVSPADPRDVRVASVPHPFVRDGERQACLNLSGEAHCRDSFGHGTFMAGLIAGTGASSGGRYTGIAPGAEIVSVKIAGRDGSADVTKLLAAIQWVVSFRQELGISVLNLSLGTNSRAPYQYDPLNYAVQRAWRAGITVVVSASNRGPARETISKPADDPLVLTVGATDDHGTPAIDDDRLPYFSSRGPTAHGLAKPDVVAPGSLLVSLRSPNSFVEASDPSGGVDANHRRASGTSMSAAVVSGVAALVHQARPDWGPDNVKHALMTTARPVADRDPLSVGRGVVHAPSAASAATGRANVGVSLPLQPSGSLDESRADVLVSRECRLGERLLNPKCDHVNGDQTANGGTWDPTAYQSDWTGSSWYGSQWIPSLGSSWYGSSWYGRDWISTNFQGSSWYGNSDDSLDYGLPLLGSSWYGAWR